MLSNQMAAEVTRELERVLQGDWVGATNFYVFEESAVDDQVQPFLDFLRQLPSGIGEAELERRLQAWADAESGG